MLEAVGPADRWRLAETLGAGGFSTVHAALDTRFESRVAVKILAENYATHVEVRERFLAEALLQRRIAGPVVPVYDIGETPSGQPFIVMALADGGDLERRVATWRETARPTSDDVHQLASLLSRAVGALHAQDVVHRDIKPSNLLLFGAGVDDRASQQLIASNETLLLGDLGFAKDLAIGSGLTIGVGTPGFVPPEQRTPGRVDRRADIWAASAVLHWFLTGHPPDESPAVRRNDLSAAEAGVELIDAIEAGMADDPAQRPETIHAWYQLVRQALIPRLPTGSDVPRRGSRLGWAIATVGVAGGLLAGFLIGSIDDGAEVSRVSSDGGSSVSTVEFDGLRVAVTGPQTLTVGQTERFTVEVPDGLADWTWISPSGSHHRRDPTLTVRATRPGAGAVRVVVTTPTGRTQVLTHDFEVVE